MNGKNTTLPSQLNNSSILKVKKTRLVDENQLRLSVWSANLRACKFGHNFFYSAGNR